MPRLKTETVGAGDQSWLGSTHGMHECLTATIDISAFTAGTHYPEGHLLSGVAVNIADLGAVVPYTGVAGEKLGFVFTNQKVEGTADFAAPVLPHGTVKTANLPIALPGTTNGAGAFVLVDGVS